MRLADVALQKLDDRGREREFGGPGQDVLLGQVILDHELGQITNNLGAWSNLEMEQDIFSIFNYYYRGCGMND